MTTHHKGLFTHIDLIGITVPDQQAALEWFTDVLEFEVREDNEFEMGRWITVGVPGQDNLKVVLRPIDWGTGNATEERKARIGTDMLTLHTEDIERTVGILRERGVTITREPEEAAWGVYALFEDPFGNTHQVIEPA